MDVLILGGSRIARRRVIPALQASETVSTIHLASRTKASAVDFSEKRGHVCDDYARALAELPSHSLVYISLANSLHTEWARTCLLSGHHVIIDKPATLSAADAQSLGQLAAERDLLLAEAVVWHYHPQVVTALQKMNEAGGVTAVAAVFSVPPFDSDDAVSLPARTL